MVYSDLRAFRTGRGLGNGNNNNKTIVCLSEQGRIAGA